MEAAANKVWSGVKKAEISCYVHHSTPTPPPRPSPPASWRQIFLAHAHGVNPLYIDFPIYTMACRRTPMYSSSSSIHRKTAAAVADVREFSWLLQL